MASNLSSRSCVPCRAGAPPLTGVEAGRLLEQVPGWTLGEGATRIERRYAFKTFAQALTFVQAVAAIAEAEDHHPDIAFGWGYANLVFQTHAVKGLHENDFVMAAKVDALPQ